MSDPTNGTAPQRDTTNEALKARHPGLLYQEIKVDRADLFQSFGSTTEWAFLGGDSGYLKIDDEIMAIAKIVDEQTILVGRHPL